MIDHDELLKLAPFRSDPVFFQTDRKNIANDSVRHFREKPWERQNNVRDDIDLKYFEKRLKERLEAIIAAQESRKEEEEPVELDQARVGRLSRMDAMQQQAISQAAARLVDLERQRIQSALGRLQSGDYGYCALCDEEIAEGRLRFDPSILTCIACAKETDS